MSTVYKQYEKVNRDSTDHQKGVVTERVARQRGEVGIMLEDGAVA